MGKRNPSEVERELTSLRERVASLEAELESSQRASTFLDSVLKAVPSIIINVDPDLRIRYVNRYYPGHSPADNVGFPLFDKIPAQDHEKVRASIERARSTGQMVTYALAAAPGPNHQPASYISHVVPVPEPDGRIGVCIATADVTEHLQRQRVLEETRAQLMLALDATELGLWSWDLTTHEVYWDERMRGLHGSDEPMEPTNYAKRLVHPEDRATMQRAAEHAMATGDFQASRFRIVRPDGGVRWVLTMGRVIYDDSGAIRKVVGGTLDMTKQHELEEQVRKAQKMEAMSNLTAGVAHNFNNMLAVILPTLEMAAQLVPPRHRPMLEDATHAAERAAELVAQLMTYTGQNPSQKRVPSDVRKLVDTAAKICRPAFDAQVRLHVEAQPKPLWTQCHPGQIEQVLVNLLLNARDAVRETGRDGLVVVRTRLLQTTGVSELVCIDVVDDGVGLSPRARAHLFEPFFTTKGVGKGTGLGLATSYAIVRDHGGMLLSPEVDKGAQFTLTLPHSAAAEAPHGPIDVRTRLDKTRLLLVDDDDAVRTTLTRVLTARGLEVLEARSGPDALAHLHADTTFDVVLLDRAMPAGPGERFVPEIKRLVPQARIIFLSGGAVEPEIAALVDAVIAKPVTTQKLLNLIDKLLATTRAD